MVDTRDRHRTRFIVVAVVVVIAVAAAAAFVVLTRGVRTVRFSADGIAPVTVTAPWSAGTPRFAVLPAPPQRALPSAVQPLSKPVRITAHAFLGTARITMTYDPAALPARADPANDLAIFVYLPDARMWLPAGDQVDTTAHTVTATTEHFSDWVLAITDPRRLTDEEEFQERMNWTLGGRIASAITVGEQDALSCNPSHLLMPARATTELALNMPMCEEALDDGSYRLQWINTTGLPVVFDPPAGFQHDITDFKSDVLLQNVLQHHRHPGGAIVRPGESLEMTFPAAGVSASTVIVGEVDWSIYLIAMMRQIMSALLLDDETDNPNARAVLDSAFETTEVYNCVADAADEKLASGSDLKAMFTAVWKCKGKIYDWIVKFAVRKTKPGKLRNVLGKFLDRRINLLLGVEEFMDIARSELAGLTSIPAVLFGHLDTSVTIEPSRVMSWPEAAALPLAAADPEGRIPHLCTRLIDTRFPPAGMPDPALCYQSVAVDLDGNGKNDRLLLWHPQSADVFTPLNPRNVGAVGYTDDGTFHLLDDPATGWGEDFDGFGTFAYRTVLHLGNDKRGQVIVTAVYGANTLHSVIFTMGADRHLHVVHYSDGATFDLADGGGAGYSSSFGCVRSQGRPVFVFKGTTSNFGPSPSYNWTLVYYRFDGLVLRQIGVREGIAATEARTPSPGSNCAIADPAKRGNEIGAINP